MKLIYTAGFSQAEKSDWKPVIFNNIIQSFREINEAMVEQDIKFDDVSNEVSRPFQSMSAQQSHRPTFGSTGAMNTRRDHAS